MENNKNTKDVSLEDQNKKDIVAVEKSIFNQFDPDELETDDEGIEGDIQSDGF